MQMQAILLPVNDAPAEGFWYIRFLVGSGGNLSFTKAGIAGRQRAGFSPGTRSDLNRRP